MLYSIHTLPPDAANLLDQLDAVRGALDPYARQSDLIVDELRRHVTAEAVHHSTRLEGNTLSLPQVESALAGEEVGAPRDQIREVQNYAEAIAYARSLGQDRSGPITEETIKTIHFLVSKSLPGGYTPGRYRAAQNYVVDRITQRRIFFPPPHEQVGELIRELVEWMNRPGEFHPAIAAGSWSSEWRRSKSSRPAGDGT